MKISQFYPLIQTNDVEGTAAFYMKHFGFKAMFESDWYYHLQSESDEAVNITVLKANHETIPSGSRGLTQNLILSFEVEDVDKEEKRLREGGIQVVQPLRDEPHGQRHVILKDPNGILIDVIMPIEPSAEFLAGYADEALPA
ncbi:MAG: VOC family protein [Litoreibacter sp.]|nr:VOC family protein [Litoreibacter sp.]MCY4335256.1 VOC family protein [Litoreibacter sp.]